MAVTTINDVNGLQEAVLDYLDRPDLRDQCANFVALAESRFNGALRAREMETQSVIGTETASGPLPPDFLEWIGVDWEGSGRIARPTFAETNAPEARYKHRPHGDPQYFVVSAGAVRMVPAKPGRLTLTYYAAIPALSAADASNWLLERAPDAYLYASIAEAYVYQKAADLAQAHLLMAAQALGAAGLTADTQKLARRPAREAELTASAQAAARPE